MNKILLVDDEESFLELSKTYLEEQSYGFDIKTISSPKKGLNELKENIYDCVVCDYQMPEISGLEFLKKVRDDLESDIPFIVFTGKGREEVAMKALNLGADRYIQKGGEPKAQFGLLAQAIDQEIKHSKAQDKLKKSEERYRRLFETAHDGMLIIDAESGEIDDANPYIQDLIGYSKEELVGKRLWEIGAFEDVAENKERFDHLVEEGYIRYEDLPLKTKEGKTAPVEFVSNSYMAGGKKVVQCNIRSISERKKEEEKLKRLMNNIPGITYRCKNDKNWTMKFVSEGIGDLTGYRARELIDNREISYRELIFPSDRNKVREEIQSSIEKQEPYKLEYRITTKEGEIKWVWERGRKIETDENGEVDLEGIIIDVSERKKYENRLIETKEEYKELLNGMNDAVFIHDLEGNFVEVNDVATERLGYTKQELLEMNPMEIDAPRYRKKVKERISDIEENKKLVFESVHVTKEGREIPVEISSSYITYQDEPAILSVAREITERKRYEENLKQYKRAIEGSEDLIAAVNEDKEYLFANKKYLKLLDLENDSEIIGEKINNFYSGEILERINKNIEKCLTGERVHYEMNRKGKDLDIRYYPLKKNGEITGVVGLLRDITKRKQAERDEKFLHSLLRHDVKNKNQVVEGYLELLKEKEMPQEGKEMTKKALDAIQESDEIIEKVRTLREIDQEQIKRKNIGELLKKVVRENRDEANQRGIEIQLGQELNNQEVRAGSLLKELFTNLIENSIKHSNGTKIKVSCIDKEKRNEVICSVEDDGKGIPKEIKEKIFERTYKKGETAGSGLGLYLVKEIAKKYDGEVEVRDSELGGARFDVTLKKPKKETKE